MFWYQGDSGTKTNNAEGCTKEVLWMQWVLHNLPVGGGGVILMHCCVRTGRKNAKASKLIKLLLPSQGLNCYMRDVRFFASSRESPSKFLALSTIKLYEF